MTNQPIDPSGLVPPERDACAIICYINKEARPTHGNVQRTIEALVKMGHRAGEINGEGDGCGVLTDIPRMIWREVLAGAGHDPNLAEASGFAVGHLLLPREATGADPQLKEKILARFAAAGVQLLVERPGIVRSEVLSSRAREGEPLFWQVAVLCPEKVAAPPLLFQLQTAIERDFPIHVASLSADVTAWKVHGAPEILPRYYPELRRREFLSSVTIGHSRYSTNTLPTVLRAQPFSLLGHNGEINTIARLREEARMMGIPLFVDGSDSQDLNRTLEGLMFRYGLSLFEAMEVVFPPIFSAMDGMEPELKSMYTWFRRFLKASAQGPAAIIARHRELCVFSVDAMGLRPLWVGETTKEIFASSELGVVPHEEILADPKPLAPGEKVGVRIATGRTVELMDHPALRREVYQNFRKRTNLPAQEKALMEAGSVGAIHELPLQTKWHRNARLHPDNLMSAFAWKSSDLSNLREMAKSGSDPIASLGYDGPLASLSNQRQNLSDYFKEQVAVVTNPAIDREREAEHFSTRVYLGPRPQLRGPARPGVALEVPLLTGGRRTGRDPADAAVAREFGTATLEGLVAAFGDGKGRCRVIPCFMQKDESLGDALERLTREAVEAVTRGAAVLLLDDSDCFAAGKAFIDPFLVTAELHKGLKEATDSSGESLRRRTSLIVRSGALRSLHDLIFALGMGADALCPYLMWEGAGDAVGVKNLLSVLAKGLEKVISTMGTHEIGGYGKYFASIGLCRHLAGIFETPNFCGSGQGGLTLERLETENRSRTAVARSRQKQPVPVQFRLYPKIWKMVGAVAKMEETYADLSRLIQQYEAENPLAIRHLLDLRYTPELTVDPDEVDTGVGGHSLPILISAMSFGSQGETPFRIYAEAAKRLNIVCMNGEGGEIADMLGKYRKNRGQQIASGRFGVNMAFLNSADFLEIKVGQGAKPGEGGHLPGFKVTAKIAAARHATPGVSLISPSNNHDIYSIEDLAQIVEELRTANPQARISVKVPAVAGIGTIALGVAKAGADIITISGYDGGTGAARKHAIKFVGLPAEIGVSEAHKALVSAGMRQKVEIWADGGARTGRDVVKLMLLGANRVGFGTMAMVVIGCTACRGCHLGTCHVGIATQIETTEEAEGKGLKRFVPRVMENGVIYMSTFFRGWPGDPDPHRQARLPADPGPGGAERLLVQPGGSTASTSELLHAGPGRGAPTVRAGSADHPQAPQLPHLPHLGARDRRLRQGGGAGPLRRRQRHQLRPGHRHPPGRRYCARGGGGAVPARAAGAPPVQARLHPRQRSCRLFHRPDQHAGGGGCPGRGREVGIRGQDRHPQGGKPRGAPGGGNRRQGSRLRRPGGYLPRPGGCRQPRLHPPLRGRRGLRLPDHGTPGRRPGRHRFPGQFEGIRLRIHDRRPGRGSGGPGSVDMLRHDRRRGLLPSGRGHGADPRGPAPPPGQGGRSGNPQP